MKDNRPNSTYLVEALELLDRVDRLLAASTRLAHLYLLFLLGYGPLPPLSSSRLRVHRHSRALRLLISARGLGNTLLTFFETHRIKSTHARTTHDARTHACMYAHTTETTDLGTARA